MLTIFLAACAPVEDIPSQAEEIYEGLAACADDLKFEACGEAVLDGFQLEWECSCPESYHVAPWSVCGTREEALDAMHEVSVDCTCDRVGMCY